MVMQPIEAQTAWDASPAAKLVSNTPYTAVAETSARAATYFNKWHRFSKSFQIYALFSHRKGELGLGLLFSPQQESGGWCLSLMEGRDFVPDFDSLTVRSLIRLVQVGNRFSRKMEE
ncbi:hypothetical protein VNO78_08648 [Psophocarpus tetragonolobus]|uniref:Uncharacterized protein n=1 Tax=Psophocarpus tetragonolobus TaxID=3891 RepID=A0AAN9SYB4_PSOTE